MNNDQRVSMLLYIADMVEISTLQVIEYYTKTFKIPEKKLMAHYADLTNPENHDKVLGKIFSDIEEKLVLKDSSYGK